MATKRWLTIPESSQLTGYDRDWLRKMVRKGEIEGKKFGTTWMISQNSLTRFVKEAEKRRAKDRRWGARTT
jgi:excisionase family DNA binding protein